MPKGSNLYSSSIPNFSNPSGKTSEGKALEQMYQQSRFEAQCWFFASLIISIMGTIFILASILLFFFQNAFLLSDSGRVALAIANIITGATQHLIINQARAANKRADRYTKEIESQADELSIYEIINMISSLLPEGDSRNHLITQTITEALLHAHEDKMKITTTPTRRIRKKHPPA